MEKQDIIFSTFDMAVSISPEAIDAQQVWLETNRIPLDYLTMVIGDVSESVSPGAPPFLATWEREREKFRAFTREQRLQRDCPFPPEPDLT